MAAGDIVLERWARLRVFYYRMGLAPPASSRQEALELMADTLHGVEDEFSGIPYDPTERGDDGRLYPPKETYRRTNRERPGVFCYFQVAHLAFVAENGAIEIRTRFFDGDSYCEDLVYEKQGSDGLRVADQ